MGVMKPVPELDPLRDIPDFADWQTSAAWIEERLRALSASSFGEAVRKTFVGLTLPSPTETMFGCYSSPSWRKLALAAFLADWTCYEEPVDRADFSRLLYVAGTFPTGFRVWFCQLEDGLFTPVGYTGWYPISETIFSLLTTNFSTIKHRGFFAPVPELDTEASYLYLFNASITARLRNRSPQSCILMKSFAQDILQVRKRGLASVTVSEDGARFSRRFGMRHVGDMMVDGLPEKIYTATASEAWM